MLIHRRLIGRVFVAAMAMALSGVWTSAQAQGVARNAAADLEDLIKAARAEGEVSFYFGPPENIAKRLTEAFTAKYGVKTRYLRMTSAPLLQHYMDHTTGSEMQVMMTARSKAKHPNAARLFANYVLSQEGNTVFNNDPGGFTVYDTSRLPKQFEFAKPETIKRKDLIVKLLLGK